MKAKVPKPTAEEQAANAQAASSRLTSIQTGLADDTQRLQRWYGARMALAGGGTAAPIMGGLS